MVVEQRLVPLSERVEFSIFWDLLSELTANDHAGVMTEENGFNKLSSSSGRLLSQIGNEFLKANI